MLTYQGQLAVLGLLRSLFFVDEPRIFQFKPWRFDLIGHYISLLLLVFVQHGIFESLIDLIGQSDSDLVELATSIIVHLIRLSNHFLPGRIAVEVLSLPGLFDLASRFRWEEDKRHRAISALVHIDQSKELHPRKTVDSVPLRSSQVRKNIALFTDDFQFKSLLAESGVLAAKSREYQKWSWGTIIELLQGSLNSKKRLDETIRNTKFFKRLCSFYRPSKRLFSSLPSTRESSKYVKAGCLLMSILTASNDGQIFLSENLLLNELVWGFSMLDYVRNSGHFQSRVTSSLCNFFFPFIYI
jgi:hypothetical protein